MYSDAKWIHWISSESFSGSFTSLCKLVGTNMGRNIRAHSKGTHHERSLQPIDAVSGNCDACEDWLFLIF